MNVFGDVDKFFASISEYLKYNYNYILIAFLSAFLFVFIVVLISTSCSYEAKLIKAIDMFNSYFMKEPQITTENLLAFNAKMKSKKVPKQLRKQWQQFVLYRDKRASEYMSFEMCVSSPLKNSTYKRDVKILNFMAYILAMASFVTNLYFSTFESTVAVASFSVVLQHTLLCPILILILNLLVTIFFDVRHNAIVNDLNQNYQYFEVNMDKASTTIPEYVDYELLFDKNEIKHGIPVLYIYLQRRAEEEKRELERARIKNVKHEKFNFDEAGVAKSLVLERAMQEAENYIAERNKFLQDTAQVNGEISQEELNFREITKEYQREMQVSKETFDNFKAQLNDASSSIEANYLKKQQQQELDRQRNLERDYDTATERHNQMMKTLQTELDSINDQLKQARTSLERGMMSEFDSYSQKVYADAERVVKERNSQDYKNKENEIIELKNQVQSLTNLNNELIKNNPNVKKKNDDDNTGKGGLEYTSNNPVDEYVSDKDKNNLFEETNNNETSSTENNDYLNDNSSNAYGVDDANNYGSQDSSSLYDNGNYSAEYKNEDYSADYANVEKTPSSINSYGEYKPKTTKDNPLETLDYTKQNGYEYTENENLEKEVENSKLNVVNNSVYYAPFIKEPQDNEKSNLKDDKESKPNETAPKSTEKANKAVKTNTTSTTENKSSTTESKPSTTETNSTIQNESEPTKRGRGRPRKAKTGEEKPKRSVGRPRKPKDESELNKPKRSRGRPKKTTTIIKKVETDTTNGGNVVNVYKIETDNSQQEETKPNQTEETKPSTKKGRGRPKKVTVVSVSQETEGEDSKDIYDNLDNYLKEIDEQIAQENAKMEESQKKLVKNSRIKRKR